MAFSKRSFVRPLREEFALLSGLVTACPPSSLPPGLSLRRAARLSITRPLSDLSHLVRRWAMRSDPGRATRRRSSLVADTTQPGSQLEGERLFHQRRRTPCSRTQDVGGSRARRGRGSARSSVTANVGVRRPLCSSEARPVSPALQGSRRAGRRPLSPRPSARRGRGVGLAHPLLRPGRRKLRRRETPVRHVVPWRPVRHIRPRAATSLASRPCPARCLESRIRRSPPALAAVGARMAGQPGLERLEAAAPCCAASRTTRSSRPPWPGPGADPGAGSNSSGPLARRWAAPVLKQAAPVCRTSAGWTGDGGRRRRDEVRQVAGRGSITREPGQPNSRGLKTHACIFAWFALHIIRFERFLGELNGGRRSVTPRFSGSLSLDPRSVRGALIHSRCAGETCQSLLFIQVARPERHSPGHSWCGADTTY